MSKYSKEIVRDIARLAPYLVSHTKPKSPLVASFLPKSRQQQYIIYAVTLYEHPGVVKIGRTFNWKSRRKYYESFNLRCGDAIEDERVFVITDEFVDLPKLERCLLERMPFPRRHGAEWFETTLDDMARVIDQFMCEHDISYV